ncbi:TetR/AcrR family transcriptional regulator [Phytomonospora endophytica]|uniref:AcrR family transcriptional regulator n=1 Tax=Phytomonospora endophytica TaxID=714109 RepID=A0A841FIQ5_9ACTN|nr:TetR/AcrR family transcriptional regulator [Phytomonospora endophytica]MBB6032519.1 AcrR family transcriptional regulator [Phytomonospora endophytica]GIG66332.1 TetR family transcriptional regulator [Phytomonospora endophytica]
MEPVTPKTPNRRERVRNATVAEIKSVARDQLTGDGPGAISLRAIARDMGMSAPALYRYFPSLEALLVALVVDLYDELRGFMETACAELPEGDRIGRLLVAAKSFRAWAVAHRPEFTLMFASVDLHSEGSAHHDPTAEPHAAAARFSQVFGRIFHELYRQTDEERGFPLPTPAVPNMSPGLQAELVACAHTIGADVPVEFSYMFLTYWIRLYGVVAMEVHGQLPVIEHPDLLFNAMLAEMAAQLRVDITEWIGTT